VSPLIVLAGVGVIAVSAAVTLAVLIIGIHRTDRPGRRHLADAPRSHSEALARRLLLGVRYPAPNTGPESELAREESRWPGK
jgi:hypothetical protein